MENRRLKMGMVADGITGFIAAIHLRKALKGPPSADMPDFPDVYAICV